VQETNVARPASRQAWLIDSADFWRLWFVGLVVFIVRWVETVAVGVFVYQHTGSPFIVAMMTMLRLLPMGLFGAFLGAIAERMERRTTLIIVVVSMVITSLTLATLAHLHLLAVWHLAVASFINGIGWATDNPVRRVMIGEAVGATQMGTAMSVDVGANNASRMIGPTIGGLLLAGVGIDGVFTLSVVLYAIAVVAACRVRYRNSYPPSTAESVIARIAEGLRLVRRDRRLIGTLTVTVVYNVFGWPFTSMVPVIGQDRPAAGTRGHRHPCQHGRCRRFRRCGVDGDALPAALLPARLCRRCHAIPGHADRFRAGSRARNRKLRSAVHRPRRRGLQHHAGDVGLPVGAARDAKPRAWRAVSVHWHRPGRLCGTRMAGECNRRTVGDRRDRNRGTGDDAADAALVARDLTRRFDPGQRQTAPDIVRNGMANFTPWASLSGGLLIGLAVALLWLGNGRVAGISGMVGNLASAGSGDVAWRVAFLAGLIAAPWCYAGVVGAPVIRLDGAVPVVIAGGLLVGFGTRLGGGCTSGHGVCGLARFSRRSIMATCLFMAAGFLTVFVMRHIAGA
jgi:uncharacterized membrane protein YedE/YeeE